MSRNVPVTVTVSDRAGNRASRTVTWRVKTAVGMSAAKGTATAQATIDYPNLRYFRDFGTDGADTDTLPELPALNAGKFLDTPSNAVPHVSWKDDVEQLGGWLDGLNRPIWLTWYHEPMGDVAPTTYRSTGARVSQIVAGHRNSRFVLGHGPIVTRWWLDEGGGNPADWGYDGMTHYGIDCYMNVPSAASYYSATKMFGTVFSKVRTAFPGIRLWVPEYGMVPLTSDTTDAGRAQAIRDHGAWLLAQPDVDGWAYWNSAVTNADYRIASTSQAAQAWRDMQAA